MKTTLLFFFTLVTFVTIATGVNAQNFKKGDWTLGANVSNLGLGHSFAKDVSVTSFDMTAAAGHFLSDKFALEANLGIEYLMWNKQTDTSDFMFGATARYYPVGNFFGYVGYRGTLSKVGDITSLIGAAVGYDWFLSEKVFFEPAVTYSHRLTKVGTNNLGLWLGIGVKF